MSVETVVMTWAEAMRAVADGLHVRREAWDDPTCVVALYRGLLCIRIGGEWKTWQIADADIYARDWTV